jgi:hypothetical protein
MMITNFDRYLKKQFKDPACATRFECAGEAWDVALDLAALRRTERNLQRQNASKDKMTRK